MVRGDFLVVETEMEKVGENGEITKSLSSEIVQRDIVRPENTKFV